MTNQAFAALIFLMFGLGFSQNSHASNKLWDHLKSTCNQLLMPNIDVGTIKAITPSSNTQNFEFSLKKLTPLDPSQQVKLLSESEDPVPIIQLSMPVNTIAWSKLDHYRYPVTPNNLFERPHTVAGIWGHSSGEGGNLQEILQYAVFNFPMAKPSPGHTYALYLRTEKSVAVRKLKGKDVFYKAIIHYPTDKDFDWTTVPLSSFVANLDDSSMGPIDATDRITHIGFAVHSNKTENTLVDESINIQIAEYLEPAFDPLHNLDNAKALNLKGRDGRLNPRQDIPLMEASIEDLQRSLTKFFQSMQDPENQLYAKKIVLSGFDAIESELNRLGLSIEPYHSGTASFFNPDTEKRVEADGHVPLDYVMRLLQNGRIIYESGEFAKLHGRWSHQLQFIAGMNGLQPTEQELVRLYFVNILAPHQPLWVLWSFLMDSRGRSIHSPAYWRDLMDN